MNASNDLHRRAMEMSALALMNRMRGHAKEAIDFFEQALDLELAAITELEEPIEPTFSVLHRSAATLALDSNQPRKAEQLASKALAGDPHPEIAEELRDLLEQINFERHLQLRGVTLEEDEIQLSLSGAYVGLGIANAAEFQKRVTDSSRLIYRIAERRSKTPFRERGPPSNFIRSNFEPFLSLPRASSYAVTMKFGRPVRQSTFWKTPDIAETVNEFMDLMGLVNSAPLENIRERIPDPPYLRNFLALAKQIAPDGQRIRLVGYTTVSKGETRSIAVTRPAGELPSSMESDGDFTETEPIELKGTLLYANAIDKNRIRLIDSENKSHTIEVPSGMMNDIVRPHWEAVVTIKVVRKGAAKILRDIEAER